MYQACFDAIPHLTDGEAAWPADKCGGPVAKGGIKPLYCFR